MKKKSAKYIALLANLPSGLKIELGIKF